MNQAPGRTVRRGARSLGATLAALLVAALVPGCAAYGDSSGETLLDPAAHVTSHQEQRDRNDGRADPRTYRDQCRSRTCNVPSSSTLSPPFPRARYPYLSVTIERRV
jgi:hypothetical protein